MKKEMAQKKGKKQKNIKILNKRVKIILLIFVIIIIGVFAIKKNNEIKSKDYISFIVNNQDVTQNLKDEIIINEDSVYLSIEDIQNLLDNDLYKEEENIVLSSDNKIAVLSLNSNEIEINGSKKVIKGQAFELNEDKIYIPISSLENVYNMEFSYIKEYKNIIIDFFSKKLESAQTTKRVNVKKEAKSFGENIEKLDKDSIVNVISDENKWCKIRTQNGNMGYIKKKYLTNFKIEREDFLEKNEQPIEAALQKNISKENISKYANRKELIEKIIYELVNKKEKIIEITYNEDKESVQYNRFKTESTAMLKECGMYVIWK